MAHERILAAFPRRPIAIQAAEQAKDAKTARLGLIILLLLLLPGLYWGWTLWQKQQEMDFLAANGVETEVVNSEGQCWSRRQISGDEPKGCNLHISYVVRPEHGGGVREADVWLAGRQPIFTPPALYDPADPSRVMLRPEAERDIGWREWIGPLVVLLIPLALLLFWLFGRGGGLKDALRDPKPVTVQIDRLQRSQNGVTAAFRRPDNDKEMLQLFPNGRTPLLLNPPPEAGTDQPWALGLLDRKGRPILLDSELSTLELTDEERAAILNA